MADKPGKNPYAKTLSELEREIRVPLEDQVTEQKVVRPANPQTDLDEIRRQLLLAGGA